tara:strand:+ start:2232 stop:2621 length:390 start_codon:yes stop_codon:yes gene_type:complete
MPVTVVEATTKSDYIRVAAIVSDGSSNINNVYAFAHSSQLTPAQKDNVTDIIDFIASNPDAVVTMFNPHTGDTTSASSPSFPVVGFVRKVITDITATPVTLVDVNAASTYNVYIVTQNNLGYNKVWESA